ncbi:MAG: exopolyphosphatase, partial [Planctomycetia bacterium]
MVDGPSTATGAPPAAVDPTAGSAAASTARPAASPAPFRTVAVIDIGTTSIRMAVAEIHPGGRVRQLETLQQSVTLGKDTFTRGSIRASTIEDCVQILKSYRRRLLEYDVSQASQIRAVATSAVREAENRLYFLDRIYSATGLQVEPIDDAEVNRVTYVGIQPFLQLLPELASERTAVVEVGGGNTELLLVHEGNVVYSHMFRIGSLRLRETLETFRTSRAESLRIIQNQIERTVEQIRHQLPDGGP